MKDKELVFKIVKFCPGLSDTAIAALAGLEETYTILLLIQLELEGLVITEHYSNPENNWYWDKYYPKNL